MEDKHPKTYITYLRQKKKEGEKWYTSSYTSDWQKFKVTVINVRMVFGNRKT